MLIPFFNSWPCAYTPSFLRDFPSVSKRWASDKRHVEGNIKNSLKAKKEASIGAPKCGKTCELDGLSYT
jgi:hypothetical protein